MKKKSSPTTLSTRPLVPVALELKQLTDAQQAKEQISEWENEGGRTPPPSAPAK